MRKKKKIFTTSQTAKILNVSKETIINWINKKHIKAFHTIGGHFRIHLKDILEFAEKNNIYVEGKWYDIIRNKCLIIDANEEFGKYIQEFFKVYFKEIEVQYCTDLIDGCICIGTFKPNVLIIDPSISRDGLLNHIRNSEPGKQLEIVIALPEGAEIDQREMKKLEINHSIFKPVKDKELYKTLSDITRETSTFRG